MHPPAAGQETEVSTPSVADCVPLMPLRVMFQTPLLNCSANGPPGLPVQFPTAVQVVAETHETLESVCPAPKLDCAGETAQLVPFQAKASADGTCAVVSKAPVAMQNDADVQST